MASPMEVFNASQTALPADMLHATLANAQSGIMTQMLENVTVLRVITTLFALAVAYDQSISSSPRRNGR